MVSTAQTVTLRKYLIINWLITTYIATQNLAWIKKKKGGCLSHINFVYLVSAVYNHSLKLQKLNPFVIVLWLKKSCSNKIHSIFLKKSPSN